MSTCPAEYVCCIIRFPIESSHWRDAAHTTISGFVMQSSTPFETVHETKGFCFFVKDSVGGMKKMAISIGSPLLPWPGGILWLYQ